MDKMVGNECYLFAVQYVARKIISHNGSGERERLKWLWFYKLHDAFWSSASVQTHTHTRDATQLKPEWQPTNNNGCSFSASNAMVADISSERSEYTVLSDCVHFVLDPFESMCARERPLDMLHFFMSVFIWIFGFGNRLPQHILSNTIATIGSKAAVGNSEWFW